jgi:enoyl-CoA hydratase
VGVQPDPWDPMIDYQLMKRCTEQFMSLWYSLKPVICMVHGPAVAGGSDIALCADLIVMSETAVIGYPPARVWGCPTTNMWAVRLSPQYAKRMLFTGDLISGKEAKEIGLIDHVVPPEKLQETVDYLLARISAVPKNQLMMMKLAINQAYENRV